jgi:hypothetical protein
MKPRQGKTTVRICRREVVELWRVVEGKAFAARACATILLAEQMAIGAEEVRATIVEARESDETSRPVQTPRIG